MTKGNLFDLRREYTRAGLLESELANCPFEQFERWFEVINRAELPDPSAMVLATADANGAPRQRTVLLKRYGLDGFVFFSNYYSAKGKDIDGNPQVNLLFPWYELERQVIISGVAEKVDAQLSDEYFASRPRGSQLAAALSRQSQIVSDRDTLEAAFADSEAAAGESDIARPAHWGGYRVMPNRFEFWQGRSSRLHDRLVYSQSEGDDSNQWVVTRLQP